MSKDKSDNKDLDSSRMDLKEIKNLLEYVKNTGLEEVYIKTELITLKVKKSLGQSAFKEALDEGVQRVKDSDIQTGILTKANDIIKDNANTVPVKAPMIGTFYSSPNPDSPPFVKVGDMVKKGQPICIIEAMKLFNEIESDKSGRVVKILVENATPVEYDQPLFLLEQV